MLYPEFRAHRISELMTEQWGAKRIPDLIEVFNVTRPRAVLEIGCYQGVSTEFWLLNCEHVTAIDPWPELVIRQNFQARCGHYPGLHMITGFSPRALMEVHRAYYDLVYIDGDHDYLPVVKDIEAAWPLLEFGGWLAGHDYGGDCPGVQKAVDQFFGSPSHRFSDGSWAIQKTRENL